MGKLIIKLDKPLSYFLVEGDQLLFASNLDDQDISQILSKIGDYMVEEVCVYIKFDTRQCVEGIQIDRICNEYIQLELKVSSSDYDGLYSIAARFGAKSLNFYSAYREYVSRLSEGVVVDTYGAYSYVVAAIQNGNLKSIQICSQDGLVAAVEVCHMARVIYVHEDVIPAFKNIETIPFEYVKTIAFLQYVISSKPCYVKNLLSGDIVENGDTASWQTSNTKKDSDLRKLKKEKQRPIKKPKPIPRPRQIKILVIYTFLSLLLGLAVYGLLKLPSDSLALESKIKEQYVQISRLETEAEFLSGVSSYEPVGFASQLKQLDNVIQSAEIMSVRFQLDSVELTLFAKNDVDQQKIKNELESYYTVTSFVFEKEVSDTDKGLFFKQYNVLLEEIERK